MKFGHGASCHSQTIDGPTKRALRASFTRVTSVPEKPNLKLGATLAVATAFLIAAQAPFSLLATKSISLPAYVLVTEIAQLCCVPFMLRSGQARKDFRSLILQRENVPKFSLLLAIGMISLLLFAFGLGKGHPVVISAVLNLDPFWAALVAFFIAGKTIPTSSRTFGICLVIAFIGALIIAVSQSDSGSLTSIGLASFVGAGIAMPVPILAALSGTLIGKWFPKVDNSATLAVTFLTAAVPTIPITLAIIMWRSGLQIAWELIPAVTLLALSAIPSF
jgi:drug/metabolite transporter (DMT)-like permease